MEKLDYTKGILTRRLPKAFHGLARRGLVILYASFLYSLTTLTSLHAGTPLTGLTQKILRNETHGGGNTATGPSYKLFSNLNPLETSISTSAKFKVFPGLGNLIVHPNAITDLTGLETGRGEITLSWSAPMVMDGVNNAGGTYDLRWSTQTPMNSETAFEAANSFNQNWTPLSPGNPETGRVVTGLPLDSTVYISIKAKDGAGNRAYISTGPASYGGIFISTLTLPPTNLVGTPKSSSTIHWEWQDNSNNESGYRVMAASGGFVSENLAANTTFFLQKDLLGPNTSFSVLVEAFNNAGVSSSTILSRYTLANTPADFKLASMSSSSIAAEWNKNFNPDMMTSYQLDISANQDFSILSGSSLTLMTSAAIQNLTPNSSYFYRVTALNAESIASNPTIDLTTVTLAAPPTVNYLTIFSTAIAVSWNSNSNPTDTLYTVQISTEFDFSDVNALTTVSLKELATVFKNLNNNTTYYFRGQAINRMGLETSFVSFGIGVTTNPTPLNYEVGISSITVIWDSTLAADGSEFRVDIATLTAGGLSTFTSEPWTASVSSWTFTQLSANTQYNFQIHWRENPTGESVFMVGGDTRTFAVVTPAPSASSVGYTQSTLVLNPASNPTFSPNDTEFSVRVTAPGTAHDQKYVPASVGGMSDMTGASISPVWQTLSQWGGAAGILAINLISGGSYEFKVKARNGRQVETDFSPGTAIYLFPSSPTISWLSGQTEDSWTPLLTSSFTAINSSHYHFKFSQSSAETFPDIGQDASGFGPGFENLEAVTVTAAAEGAWFFYAAGDNFGFGDPPNPPNTSHSATGGSKFKINIDTTLPIISSLTAQFSPTDPTPIPNNADSAHKQPYFIWSSPILDSLKESPIAGYSTLFSTYTDPGEAGLPYTITTLSTSTYFQMASGLARESTNYYFRVRAKDTAGNWGHSALFVYKYLEDSVSPKIVQAPLSSVLSPEGRYLSVSSSPTFKIQFDGDMKEDTVTSTQTVRVLGIRDNLANDKNQAMDISLQYDSVQKQLQITSKNLLPSGWLFELTISTLACDLGGNPMTQEFKTQFETLMDRTVFNRVKGTDALTVLEIPAYALSEDASISVTLISGSAAPSPSTSFHSPQYSPSQSIQIANQKIISLLGDFAQPVTLREFTALPASGEPLKSNFKFPVTVTTPYLDADNDEIVDGTNPRVRAKKLLLYVLDETKDLWERLPLDALNTAHKTVKSNIFHFSIYALIGAPDLEVDPSYAYPVPFRPSEGDSHITFASLPSEGNIRVYTVAGELAQKINFFDPQDGKLLWDVKNSAGEPLASDVYIYIVESGKNKKIGKIMVIR